MIFHKSLVGLFGNDMRADKNGFVGTSVAHVLALEWEERPTKEWAREVAAHNRRCRAHSLQASKEFWAAVQEVV